MGQSGDGDDKGRRAVQSIEVGGRLLLALADRAAPMSLKDLAAVSGLSPSRAHPYLVSFGRLRLVEQDSNTGHYALGSAALQLGLACLHQLDAVKAASPVAERLASATGHAVALAVWGNFGPTVIRMIEARQPLHVAMRAGTVMSILGTATGRAFAAVMPVERLEQAMAGPLGAGEGQPRPSLGLRPNELRKAVAEVREHGVARAEGRPIPGVNAFSAVAFDHEGEPAIVVTVLGHEDTFPSDWGSSVASAVRAAAAEISTRLGFRSPRMAVPR